MCATAVHSEPALTFCIYDFGVDAVCAIGDQRIPIGYCVMGVEDVLLIAKEIPNDLPVCLKG
jgi:hypothetical protein